MDISILLGLLSGIGLILYGISGSGTLSGFFNPAGLAITLGGTLAAMVMSFPVSAFKNVPKHLKIICRTDRFNHPARCVEKITAYALEARRKGLLALEREAADEPDPFLKKCVLLIVDAIEPTKAKEILESELDYLEERHAKGWAFYERAAAYATAFGMIGALIGLIGMLRSLGAWSAGDAAAGLGAGMSTALVCVFYGALFANFIFMPTATRLKARHEEEMLCKSILVDGVLSIHSGTNPKHIEERLKSYVASAEADKSSARPGKLRRKKLR